MPTVEAATPNVLDAPPIPEGHTPSEDVVAPVGWFAIELNLIRELAVTQFKLKYTGSVLGYMWSLLKPLMLFVIMYAVFQRLLHTSGSIPRFPFQLLLGIVIWTFFAETVGSSVNVIVANTGLIKKAAFARPVLVLAASLSAFMTFAINLLLVLVIGIILRQLTLGWESLLIIPLVIELYALILGLGLFLSALFVYYRDLGHVWEIMTQVLFYGSAVVYPLSASVIGRKAAQLIALNPTAQVIEDSRHILVTRAVPWTETVASGWAVAVPFACVVIAVVAGLLVFKKLSPDFAEQL